MLTEGQLLRLQRLVIGGDTRFLRLGRRVDGGFVGGRDRDTNAPLPDHISAGPDDLAALTNDEVSAIETIYADLGLAEFWPYFFARNSAQYASRLPISRSNPRSFG
jgi:hypothetical protein